MPRSELVPLAQFVHSLPNARLPLCIVGASPSLIRVVEDNRNDGKRFVVHLQFTEEVFLQCVRQAHQDVSGMVEMTSLVDYVVIRLKSAIYEDWTEGKVLLGRSVRQGFVVFEDLRELLTDLIDLWPSIRLYIRCTGLPHVKDHPDSVSCSYSILFCMLLILWFLFDDSAEVRCVSALCFEGDGPRIDFGLGLVAYRFGLLQLMLDTCM